MWHSFLLCFLPLCVAVDAIGVLPLFLSLTQGCEAGRVKRIILQSVITAVVVALLFVLLGKLVLRVLGITVEDFKIAGGVLLFVISMRDILSVENRARHVDVEELGVVPLGVPLIAGPAVLTTSLFLLNAYGLFLTTTALIANIALAGVTFLAGAAVYRLLGKAGTKAVSKIASLLLAAIAVMMVRKGISDLLAGAG